MDNKELKKLLEILSDSEVTKFEMEKEGIKIKLSRGAISNVQISPVALPVEYSKQPPAPSPLAAESRSHEEPMTTATAPEEDSILNQDGIHIVTSPIVGTFYHRPNPKADPFVDLGDKVKEGQILCIVEAMKLMNEITADASGEIVKIFIEDAQPVEYGEPLFAIKTK
jgi:acetyl-CoA carboxylase biotin carboxyl carrier protein